MTSNALLAQAVRFGTGMTKNTTVLDGSFGVPSLGRSVSLKEASRLLDVSRRTIYTRIKTGALLTVRTIGGSQRVLVESISRTNQVAALAQASKDAAPTVQVTTAPSWRRPFHGLARLRWIAALLLTASAAFVPDTADAQTRQGRRARHARVSDDLVQTIDGGSVERTSVILTATPARINALAARHGLRVRKRLATGALLEVPAGALAALADDADVDQLSGNARLRSQMAVTNVAIGADQVQLGGWAQGVRGLTGKGVGVAVIDSGVSHLAELRGRVVADVDFTGTSRLAKDQYGHGTHVAGIIAAAMDRNDIDHGVAPGANIINLKVLDQNGAGSAADVIEAIDWAVANRVRFNIRVINLSLGGPVRQSWRDDPLSHAVERAYRASIVVVAAAGNFGRVADGRSVYGGITSPGNSPFALTVGALNGNGTTSRADDVVAAYSSKGPTMFDRLVKPDVVAPGSRITSLLAPGSTLATTHPERIVNVGGRRRLQISGTSMAAAVASGAAAQIIGAYPKIAPVGVRFRMQYSASRNDATYVVAEGAGSLNLLGSIVLGMPSVREVVIATEATEGSKFIFGHADVWGQIDLRAGLSAVLWGDGIIWAGSDEGIIWAGSDEGIIWAGSDEGIIWAGSDDGIIWAGSDDGIIWAGSDEGIIWAGSDEGIIWAGSDEGIIWAGSDEGIIWAGSDEGIIWAGGDEGIV
jgi:serine protease AprX